ncbi:hypothetical protein H8959_022585 [Pygathrix nigripes]
MLQARKADLIFLLSPPTETTAEPQRAPDLQESDGQRKGAQSRSLTLRLQKCQLQVHDAETLIALLQEGPHLEEVDLSGNQLEDEGCRLMAEAASQLHIARKLDLSDNGLSLAGVHCVLRAVSACWTLAELHIRWELPQTTVPNPHHALSKTLEIPSGPRPWDRQKMLLLSHPDPITAGTPLPSCCGYRLLTVYTSGELPLAEKSQRCLGGYNLCFPLTRSGQ